ncbi:MAG: hypothetical protein CMF39_01610, partial [Legionellaceae bacterium]|nr:hypothetical protein [Legionellaceae bacterium]
MKVAPDIFLAKPKLSFNELVLFLQYLLLFASLAYSYMFIFPKFSSSSPYYLHVQFNPAACCVSMLFLFLWAFVVREKVESFSALFLTLFFSTIIIPLLVIYSCGGMPGIFVFYSASALMVLNFFVYSRFSLVCFKPAQQQAVALMLCAAVVLSVLLLFFLKDGYSHVNFSFRINKLYPKRAYADNYIFSGIFSYLISWFGKVCNIFLIIYFLARKRYFIFLFFVFIQIIFASIASEKSFFIYSFFSIFFYYFMRFSKSQNFFVFLLNALVIVSVYLYYFF